MGVNGTDNSSSVWLTITESPNYQGPADRCVGPVPKVEDSDDGQPADPFSNRVGLGSFQPVSVEDQLQMVARQLEAEAEEQVLAERKIVGGMTPQVSNYLMEVENNWQPDQHEAFSADFERFLDVVGRVRMAKSAANGNLNFQEELDLFRDNFQGVAHAEHLVIQAEHPRSLGPSQSFPKDRSGMDASGRLRVAQAELAEAQRQLPRWFVPHTEDEMAAARTRVDRALMEVAQKAKDNLMAWQHALEAAIFNLANAPGVAKDAEEVILCQDGRDEAQRIYDIAKVNAPFPLEPVEITGAASPLLP
jgi:hypothetical protein